MGSETKRKTKKMGPPRWRRILNWTTYIVFLVLALAAGTISGWIAKSSVASALVRQGLLNTPPTQVFRKDSINLLILGCDEDRYYGGDRGGDMKPGQILRKYARADMILVARLDFKDNVITGLSIPRDTLVDIEGYKPMKITSFHGIGKKATGEALTVRAVQTIIPVRIDRVLTLDYDAFQNMVNIVGGVTVDVKRPMKYEDIRGGLKIDLDPGVQQLDGYTAMGYVRYRKGDSDFERQKRQKDFMLRFKDAAIRNPSSITSLLEEARAFIGNTLTPEEIASLAFFGRKVPNEEVRLGQIPVVKGRGTNLEVDQDELPRTLKDFRLTKERNLMP
ncbi:MAG: LCP family protein [Fimbriimonas sp.]